MRTDDGRNQKPSVSQKDEEKKKFCKTGAR